MTDPLLPCLSSQLPRGGRIRSRLVRPCVFFSVFFLAIGWPLSTTQATQYNERHERSEGTPKMRKENQNKRNANLSSRTKSQGTR